MHELTRPGTGVSNNGGGVANIGLSMETDNNKLDTLLGEIDGNSIENGNLKLRYLYLDLCKKY